MLLDELLHKGCGGVMLRPVALVKSAFPRTFYYCEVCAHIGLHLHETVSWHDCMPVQIQVIIKAGVWHKTTLQLGSS